MPDDRDEVRVWKFREQRFHRTRGLRRLAENCFSGTARIQPALQATPIKLHYLATLLPWQCILKTCFPQFVDVQEQKKNRLGHERVNKETVVLLRFVEAHPMHVVPAAKPFLLR